MAGSKEAEDIVNMHTIDRLCNLATAANWAVVRAIKRMATFKAPIESDRTYATIKALHDKMILDTVACGNKASEAGDCLKYFSDEFPVDKKTSMHDKVQGMALMITKTMEESDRTNIKFEQDEEVFLAEREETEKEEKRISDERKQAAEATASAAAAARQAAAALNPFNLPSPIMRSGAH